MRSSSLTLVIETVTSMDPFWSSNVLASTVRISVFVSAMIDVMSARMPLRSSTSTERVMSYFVPFSRFPGDVDAPLGVHHEVQQVRTVHRVHRHTLAARDVAGDTLAGNGVAAFGAVDHEVVHPVDFDLVLSAPENSAAPLGPGLRPRQAFPRARLWARAGRAACAGETFP